MTAQQLLWDWGTAYDLFASLVVLHEPADFGLRGAWAAGVRARLPVTERQVLEHSLLLWHAPFHWIYTLPKPKDGTTVLWALGQVPPAERLPSLALSPEVPSEMAERLRAIADQGQWDEADRRDLRSAYQRACDCEDEKKVPSPSELAKILDIWINAEQFGEQYLQALRVYQEVFFAEEERRIGPALQSALDRAQELAERQSLPDLLEELSQGLRFDVAPEADKLVLVPSYWCTPLVFFGKLSAERDIWLFGARPADASVVPGEVVPETLVRALKALSDPTRLRMLHALSQETLTPAELARHLRLRAPTITHHLKILRLSGLVQLTLGEGKATKCYAIRSDAVASACTSLKLFLEKNDHGNG